MGKTKIFLADDNKHIRRESTRFVVVYAQMLFKLKMSALCMMNLYAARPKVLRIIILHVVFVFDIKNTCRVFIFYVTFV